MTPMERKTTEDAIAELQKALDDPWRPIRLAKQGIDPIIIEAVNKQYSAIIDEFKERLAVTNG